MDADTIRARLARLDQQLAFLETYVDVDEAEFLADHCIHSTVERDLHIAIECVLDIANHITVSEALGEPASYRDCILLLINKGFLPRQFAESFASVASFRNILVHDYVELNRRLVFQFLTEKLEDFRTFANHMKNLV